MAARSAWPIRFLLVSSWAPGSLRCRPSMVRTNPSCLALLRCFSCHVLTCRASTYRGTLNQGWLHRLLVLTAPLRRILCHYVVDTGTVMEQDTCGGRSGVILNMIITLETGRSSSDITNKLLQAHEHAAQVRTALQRTEGASTLE